MAMEMENNLKLHFKPKQTGNWNKFNSSQQLNCFKQTELSIYSISTVEISIKDMIYHFLIILMMIKPEQNL